jgi:thiol-disulfide isomerase/thioredoxin
MLKKEPSKPTPGIGAVPPEVTAKDWLNTPIPPSLAALKGKVVVVEFWATWCAPCVASIPHLNKLHKEYSQNGLVILSFTDQSKEEIQKFKPKEPIQYIVGTGSNLSAEYGSGGVPYAFVIGRDGRLAWHGTPTDRIFDSQIHLALKAQ